MQRVRLAIAWFREQRPDAWLVFGGAGVLIAVAVALALAFVRPAPPDEVVLAYSPDEAGQRHYIKRYTEYLARYGIRVRPLETRGTAETVDAMQRSNTRADLGFAVSGALRTRPPAIETLGALTHAPLWILYRGEVISDIGALQGKRIAAGKPGSATRVLTEAMLALSTGTGRQAVLVDADREQGLQMLQNAEVDAQAVLSTPRAPFLRDAVVRPGVRLLSFARAEAYERRLPFLERVNLPRGVLDLPRDLPPADVSVPSPSLHLLARDDLHPALASVFLRAATEIHGQRDWLEQDNQFPMGREFILAPSAATASTAPTTTAQPLPLSVEAKRYFRNGPPVLQRYLPFWLANLIDRLWVLLIPFFAVVLPVVRFVPTVYVWRLRQRIYSWYAELKTLELEFDGDEDAETLQVMLARLDTLDRNVARIAMPKAWTENLYTFRSHVHILRRKVGRRMDAVRAIDTVVRHDNRSATS